MSVKYCYSRHLDTLVRSLLALITGILGAVTVGQLPLILVSNFVVSGYCVLGKRASKFGGGIIEFDVFKNV